MKYRIVLLEDTCNQISARYFLQFKGWFGWYTHKEDDCVIFFSTVLDATIKAKTLLNLRFKKTIVSQS